MIKVAMIGAGIISRSHIPAWLKLDNAKVIGVADLVPDRAMTAAKATDAERWTTDYRELLDWDEVDAVDILTTETSHRQIACDAAAAGKDILLEKPIAPTLSEADEIIEAAKRNAVTLMIAQSVRFNERSRMAKASIESGDIGTPVYIRYASGHGAIKEDWTGDRVKEIEQFTNVTQSGIHIMDLFNYWLGEEPETVYAQARDITSQYLRIYDYFAITLKYKSGAIAVTERSQTNRPRWNDFTTITIIGTEGEISSGTQNESRWWYGEDGLKIVTTDNTHPFEREIKEFIDSLEEGRPPEVTGEDGRRALAMCLAAKESIRTGEVVAM